MTREQFIESLKIEGLKELLDSYKSYDQLSCSIRVNKEFKCVDGCGECCNTPSHKLEVSVFEMIPLAIELFRLEKADEVLDLLESLDTHDSVCVLYRHHENDSNKGFCSMHQQRPLICRLFGGGVRIGKGGKKELLLCRQLKDIYLPKQQTVDDLLAAFPIIKEYCSEVRSNNMALSENLYPINEAIRKALEWILTKWYYTSMDEA